MTAEGSAPDSPSESVVLFRTKARGRLHIMGCTHLTTTDPTQYVEADARDRAELELCTECDREIRGVGRIEYPSFDAACEALNLPVENRPRMREIAARLEYSRVWAPQGRSYVAVGHLDGRAAVAYFNRGFVDVHRESGGYEREEMPNYAGPSGATRRGVAEERAHPVCPGCGMQLPATGICDDCG